MENTGRIAGLLSPTARRIVFGDRADAAIDADLWPITEIDRAHIVMLFEQGIVERGHAARLLAAISQLRADGFAALRGKPAPRGLYLLYENHLIECLGVETGGALHTGRSRNDLGATSFLLQLRRPLLRLLRETLRLQAVLIGRARRHLDVVMPAYTHHQAAQPITYGHWLAGIARAIERDAALLDGALCELDECPLGAGAVAGTSFPIATERTAELLGFRRPARHSIDAVAHRPAVLRLLAATAVLGVSLSRLATDLLLWSTAEFDFLTFPDCLVGSSSMMPQKRNPFLLEHVQGLAAKPLGAFMAAATASHAKPFSNSIAANTQGASVTWDALRAITDAVVLARLTVAFVRPNANSMRRRTVTGFTAATELANKLVRAGLPFREAHHRVGAAIQDALAAGDGDRLHDAVIAAFADVAAPELAIDAVIADTRYGGGPAPESVATIIAETHAVWRRQFEQLRAADRRWRDSALELDARADGLIHSLRDEVAE